ncbi:MAG: hypothetical protein JO337_02005, partial [Acidimicrobiales bacterium]|nr:hypothetical protein [Acidimicrobiales bacterium]
MEEIVPLSSGHGPVVLDIGGHIGAAVVYAEPSTVGEEIEIRRRGDRWQGRHTVVRLRPTSAGETVAAVFESLVAGAYEVRLPANDPTGKTSSFVV